MILCPLSEAFGNLRDLLKLDYASVLGKAQG